MKLTRHMKEFASRCGAKIKRRDWGFELCYDSHGSVSFDSEVQFIDAMSAYLGSHPNYLEAFGDYLKDTGR